MKKAMNLSGRNWVGPLLFGLLIVAIASPARAQKGNAANGEKLFADKCVKCHDKDGSGGTAFGKALKAADLRSAEVQKKSDADFYTQIDKGKGNMPPFGNGLDKSQIEDLVAFVRQLGKSGDAKKR